MGGSKPGENHSPETLEAYGFSDRGSVRSNNEDYFGYYIPADMGLKEKRGSLFAISDGVGGSAAGEVASAEAVNVLLQEYYFGSHTEEMPDRLRNAFQCTALHIYALSLSYSSARNMKCTLTTLLLKQNHFFITHIGDSKILLLRNGRIIQLTKDHNLAGKLLRLGLITPEDARSHPNKNILLRAIGEGPMSMPDFSFGALQSEDLFCLITDGILEHATAEELNSFLQENGPSQDALIQLIAELNRRGGYDNMTILAVKVNSAPC
ncbi:MAG: PP2C family serine/threonine-protein phosphatase [Syntrophobacteraceae bacterium]|jgi:protein phosphatase